MSKVQWSASFNTQKLRDYDAYHNARINNTREKLPRTIRAVSERYIIYYDTQQIEWLVCKSDLPKPTILTWYDSLISFVVKYIRRRCDSKLIFCAHGAKTSTLLTEKRAKSISLLPTYYW